MNELLSHRKSQSLILAQQQWDQGDWETLIQWDVPEMKFHPQKGMLALLCSGAYLRLGQLAKSRELAQEALQFGISGADLNRFLFSTDRPNFNSAIQERQFESTSINEFGNSVHSSSIDDGIVKKIQDELKLHNPNPYAHNRTLTPNLNKDLRNFATEALGLERVKPAYIDYLALKAIDIERNCIGRLATRVQDAVARQLVAESLQPENRICILEIGALYGISLAILYNHAVSRYSEVKIICLDPFDGYYGQAFDAQLNQPVNDLTFMRNMELSRIPESNFQVIKKYSTDPKAIAEASNLEVNLLIIDGDHSYEGVKFDFDNYFPHLLPGGFVIFDDYNAKEWPGVQKFIDEDLNQIQGLVRVGAISRTMVFRKAK